MYRKSTLSAALLFGAFCIVIPSIESAQAPTPTVVKPNRQYALSNRCTSQDREEIARCDDESRRDWDIRDYDHMRESRKFCCYIWSTLSCELGIAQRCDPEYAARLSYLTEQGYGSLCEWHGRRSVSCALRWWSLGLIILAMIAILAIAGFVAFRKRQGRVSYEYSTQPGLRVA